MSSRSPLLGLALAAMTVSASVQAAEPVATRPFSATGFTGVSLRGPDDVVVRPGPFSITATGPRAVLERLKIGVSRGTLVVSRDSRPGTRNGKAQVIVTMPAIASASLPGAGNMVVQRVAGPSFSATLAGAGDLTVQALEAQAVRLELTGAGDIEIAGRAQRVSATLNGAGDIGIEKLAARDLSVVLNGAGDVAARASGIATVRANGVGSVKVTGGAKCQVTKGMLATVRCG